MLCPSYQGGNWSGRKRFVMCIHLLSVGSVPTLDAADGAVSQQGVSDVFAHRSIGIVQTINHIGHLRQRMAGEYEAVDPFVRGLNGSKSSLTVFQEQFIFNQYGGAASFPFPPGFFLPDMGRCDGSGAGVLGSMPKSVASLRAASRGDKSNNLVVKSITSPVE